MTMLEGGCMCGDIRYRITGDPVYSVVCHCRSCRRANGAMSTAWITVARSAFRFVAGFPQAYPSSPGVVRKFCKTCGSSLTYENSGSADSVDITTATLDHPEHFAPLQEVWLEHKVQWQPVDPTLRHFARGMTLDAGEAPISN